MGEIKDDRPKCGTCAYWDKDEDPTGILKINSLTGATEREEIQLGTCKRYAPAKTSKRNDTITPIDQWCGEHQDFYSWAQGKHIDKIATKVANSPATSETEMDFIGFLIEHILKEHQIPKEIFEIPRHPNYHNRFMELVRNPLVDKIIFKI